MKKRIFITIGILLCVASGAAAQTSSSAMQVVTFTVKITPKVTAALETPMPGGSQTTLNTVVESVDIGSAIATGTEAEDLVAKLESDEDINSVDRTLVFTVSE